MIDIANPPIQHLRDLFGAAPLLWKRSRDPEIPEFLRDSDDAGGDEAVLCVCCGSGLAALAVSDQELRKVVGVNAQLCKALRSGWPHGWIFWLRTTVAEVGSYSNCGVELLQAGLIPIAYNPAQIRTRMDYEGPLIAFESLNLAAWLDPATAPPLMDPQIPAGIVCQIQGLFGEVGASLGSASDSGIPACVRPTETQDRKVVTVCCGRGLGAVVIIEAKQLGRLESSALLKESTLTTFEGRYICWVRCGQQPFPEGNVDLAEGVVFVVHGQIPVAGDQPEGAIQVVRQGTIPQVELADLQAVFEMVDSTAQRPSERPEAAAETAQAQGSTAPPDGLISELGAVFGSKHVLQHLNANDPRFPPDLLRGGEAENGSEVESPPSWNLLGIECGPDRDAHLATVLFRNQEAIEEFVEQNPAAYQVITGCGPLTAAWLRVRGPVPRNLDAGALLWFAEGVIPVGLAGHPLKRPLEPQVSLPVVEFRDFKWSAEVANTFEIDELAQCYGELFPPVRRREFAFNDLLFSKILLLRFNLVYDLKQEGFRRYDAETGRCATVPEKELRRMVTNRLIQLAKDHPEQFPPSEISSNRVKKLIFLMESQAAVELPSEEEALHQYFSQIPEACEGAKLTGEEFYEGHAKFCRARRWPLCSRAFFDRRATEKFGDTSHCYGANGTQRGRTGWRLKHDLIVNPGLGEKNSVTDSASGVQQ